MNLTFEEIKIAQDDGFWLCFKVKEISAARKLVLTFRKRLYDLIVKEHRERRSLDANAYCWVMLDKLAEATGVPKTEIYRRAIRAIGGVSDVVCVQERAADALISGWGSGRLGWFCEKEPSKLPGCVNVTLYYGSSVYDTKQMSRLIDHIIEDCRALDIETMPPERLAAMKEEWGRA